MISSVFKVISKNSDGFEDIDQFWNATEKLTFPLESRLKASLFAAKTVTPVKQTPTKADSDVEFNYDTSSTISGKFWSSRTLLYRQVTLLSLLDDEEDDDEEEESESEDDKDDHNDEPSLAEISTKSGKGTKRDSSFCLFCLGLKLLTSLHRSIGPIFRHQERSQFNSKLSVFTT